MQINMKINGKGYLIPYAF